MKKVHVQSLARNKHPEALAEDVVNLKQELNRAKDEAKLALTEKRRLEAEVVKLKQSLLKSEELMNNKERVMGSTTGISQLYRSPDTTHLVGNLKVLICDSLHTRILNLTRPPTGAKQGPEGCPRRPSQRDGLPAGGFMTCTNN